MALRAAVRLRASEGSPVFHGAPRRSPRCAPTTWLPSLFILALIPALPAAGLAQEVMTGQVVGIKDADTLQLSVMKSIVTIRLDGIDAPEKGQPFGAEAKSLTAELALGKPVNVILHGQDKYGRTIGDVVLPGGKVLNQELVKAGLAWWYREYAPAEANLQRLEAEAKEARRGLWTDPHPQPPWEFRHQGLGAGTGPPIPPGAFVASSQSKKYHRQDCQWANKISPTYRVIFPSAEDARKAGYVPCRVCNPP